MRLQPQRIQRLSDEAQRQITSSVRISSLTNAVLGLLQNSFDASAHDIRINIDFRKGSCSVWDDGEGIIKDAFGEDGGLARLYCRFKVPAMDSI